ncbi:hypothetical protein [Methylobacterium gregans]|uniref:Uncharacterized protein n=1 Tax=Methylobacterium gregans TaxID=374424 RepID=A0AA37HKR9_9HYPH|nr:hypothetical protein [Methylobacterium gregans]MDQ0522874.1 hypothetical protein [Methylobacterium gregans]GJD77171.1 hypothetical protein NBEOAGPD_0374 [Methylobacterium gregans]GLS55769.1 hypothetical protein GCM10007886_39540 [Methylobacterium gregans]
MRTSLLRRVVGQACCHNLKRILFRNKHPSESLDRALRYLVTYQLLVR